MRVATDFLKGRIVEANLADLNKDEDQNYRKIRLQLLVCRQPTLLKFSTRVSKINFLRMSLASTALATSMAWI
jgi:ribosomal protein S3AE